MPEPDAPPDALRMPARHPGARREDARLSLATRCTACATVFRVVQDQLKVSEGWVRCGRCNEVFNALEGLFDLERETAPGVLPSLAPAPPHRTADLAADLAERAADLEADPFEIEAPSAKAAEPWPGADRIEPHGLQSSPRRAEHAGSTPAARVSQRDRLDFPDARFDSELLPDEVEPSAAGELAGLALDDGSAPAVDPVAPEFIRDAQRQQRWSTSKMRAALKAATVVLAVVLGLQWLNQFRDGIAARLPVLQPVLAAWCGAFGCTIEPPRRIEDVSVESATLTSAGGPDAFKLSVALRNRGALTLALPSVDLSLTDPSGQLVARRVLTPRDFRATSTLLAPGADAALQLVLTAGNAGVTGYTVEIFYP